MPRARSFYQFTRHYDHQHGREDRAEQQSSRGPFLKQQAIMVVEVLYTSEPTPPKMESRGPLNVSLSSMKGTKPLKELETDDESTWACSSLDTISSSSGEFIRKKTRFTATRFGKVSRTYYEPRPDIAKEDLEDLWYTKEDFKKFRRSCAKKAKPMSETVFVDQFKQLYRECLERKTKESQVATDVLNALNGSGARGLEMIMVPGHFEVRRTHSYNVLEAQRTLSKSKAEHSTQVALIATVSAESSSASRQLAAILALGDCLVAQKLHRK